MRSSSSRPRGQAVVRAATRSSSGAATRSGWPVAFLSTTCPASPHPSLADRRGPVTNAVSRRVATCGQRVVPRATNAATSTGNAWPDPGLDP